MTNRAEEHEAIAVPIQSYIDGIGRHDTELVRQAFHADAVMSSHMGENFAIVPAIKTIVDYMNSVPPIHESSPNFRGRIVAIEQAGSMANAVIAEEGLEGLDFTTYFHLHKVDGRWLISSKATHGVPIAT